MKKAILKTTLLAAIASLTMSGYVLAHHPAEDSMPDERWDFVDAQISEQHITIIDAMLEDGDLMASTSQGMDGGEPTTAMGVGANATQTTNQSDVPTDTAAGMSDAAQSRTGRR